MVWGVRAVRLILDSRLNLFLFLCFWWFILSRFGILFSFKKNTGVIPSLIREAMASLSGEGTPGFSIKNGCKVFSNQAFTVENGF